MFSLRILWTLVKANLGYFWFWWTKYYEIQIEEWNEGKNKPGTRCKSFLCTAWYLVCTWYVDWHLVLYLQTPGNSPASSKIERSRSEASTRAGVEHKIPSPSYLFNLILYQIIHPSNLHILHISTSTQWNYFKRFP